jgi:AraC family transcriptional regulator
MAMERLLGGQNFGKNRVSLQLKDLIITEQTYNPNVVVPWHYHDNAYLAYHLKGSVTEVNKKMTYICSPSTILYHNWQDPHCNSKLSPDLQIFHIEFKPQWFKKHNIRSEDIQGSFKLENPLFKSLLRKLYYEAKLNDAASGLSIEGLLLQVMAEMLKTPHHKGNGIIPTWVEKVKEILHSNTQNISLNFLSQETLLHPVQLSREFPKYFGTSFGEYIRNIRLEKATAMLSNRTRMLTEIAFECGFSDQSHFIRCFKQKYGMTPNQYRKI